MKKLDQVLQKVHFMGHFSKVTRYKLLENIKVR